MSRKPTPRSGTHPTTKRRARTTTLVIMASTQNGTSSALAACEQAWRGAAWATPRILILPAIATDTDES